MKFNNSIVPSLKSLLRSQQKLRIIINENKKSSLFLNKKYVESVDLYEREYHKNQKFIKKKLKNMRVSSQSQAVVDFRTLYFLFIHL